MPEFARTTTQMQRRRRSIAMDEAELDAFLHACLTCRLATYGGSGFPHVSPVWFVWHDNAVWISSLVRSQRWVDIAASPRVSAVFDTGERYGQLRGVRIDGIATPVGDIPRTAREDPRVAEPERLLTHKYTERGDPKPDGRHAWLRIDPVKISSWDHSKIAAARAAKRAAARSDGAEQ
ncbi:pyridoxamine 5'-phosphate oxidase family protein [Dactylosporangium sp. CA-092794]|uniref:pyridoxamine 5'-phosphate oxidase family protein n=1 Tax=Dactylosporangium sp. CA-092794 TaxID=3239929 RepID=UPI003D94D36E